MESRFFFIAQKQKTREREKKKNEKEIYKVEKRKRLDLENVVGGISEREKKKDVRE